jgi:hypothetical protein
MHVALMHVILWIVIALGAAALAMFIMVRRAQRVLPPIVLPPGEHLPKTALQQLALQTLAPVSMLTLAAVAVVAYHGADVWWDNDRVRLTATGLLVAALAVFTYYITRVRIWIIRDDGTLDERDRAILASAPAGQAPAMMVTLAAWMLSLVERYHATHLVPSPYLYLIFWSLLMVSILAALAGVVIGYRRH